ncbi:small integral membrane protein 38 isoform X2 [Meles meles]|uniref:small integral membrane protein 38 isoform X2 n=1 Tax=Meles meles TaxID=9662 RepID=UPI001E698FCE|nr:small integral membrane protein 38 isoform X2 [Meles meles]
MPYLWLDHFPGGQSTTPRPLPTPLPGSARRALRIGPRPAICPALPGGPCARRGGGRAPRHRRGRGGPRREAEGHREGERGRGPGAAGSAPPPPPRLRSGRRCPPRPRAPQPCPAAAEPQLIARRKGPIVCAPEARAWAAASAGEGVRPRPAAAARAAGVTSALRAGAGEGGGARGLPARPPHNASIVGPGPRAA